MSRVECIPGNRVVGGSETHSKKRRKKKSTKTATSNGVFWNAGTMLAGFPNGLVSKHLRMEIKKIPILGAAVYKSDTHTHTHFHLKRVSSPPPKKKGVPCYITPPQVIKKNFALQTRQRPTVCVCVRAKVSACECIKRMNPGEISNGADRHRSTKRTADCLMVVGVVGWGGGGHERDKVHPHGLLPPTTKSLLLLVRQTWRTMRGRDNRRVAAGGGEVVIKKREPREEGQARLSHNKSPTRGINPVRSG